MKTTTLALAAALPIVLTALPAGAAVIEISPGDDVAQAVAGLQPGDELVLQGGTYMLPTSLFTITLVGTAQLPIVIRAKDGEIPIITRPDANQNTINVDDSSYLTLRGLEVMGGSHGIRTRNATFVTIEDCHIHDTGDVAISANATGNTYEGLRLLRNHIHDTSGTGEGMYLGCNNNGCQMFDSLIEGNYIHHTNGVNVSQGDGIEIKEGSYNNIVRDNVIHDTGYPCILTYGTVGNGGPNILERNVMWNCGDHAIQAAADVIIRNNIILGAAYDGIRNQTHQSASPANIEILHNTIIAPNANAIRSSGIVGSVLIANNALFAQSGNAIRVDGDLNEVVVIGNAGVGSVQGVTSGFDNGGNIGTDLVAASYSGSVPNDVFPATGSLLIAAGEGQHVVADDFNGTDRGGVADIGAYRYDANGNPGWTLQESFKEVSSSGAGGGGGSSSSGTGGSGGVSSSGTGGQGGSSSSSSSGTTSTSSSGDSEDDGGCGCRVAGATRGGLVGWLLGALAFGALAGRRRRSVRRG